MQLQLIDAPNFKAMDCRSVALAGRLLGDPVSKEGVPVVSITMLIFTNNRCNFCASVLARTQCDETGTLSRFVSDFVD